MATHIRKQARRYLYIEERMRHLGLSDIQVAGRLGVTRQTIWKWCREQSRLSPDKIAGLASALDCEPEDLWRPPTRPSVDALLRGESDEMVQKALEMITILRRSG